MTRPPGPSPGGEPPARRRPWLPRLLVPAVVLQVCFLLLATAGDLRARPWTYFAVHGIAFAAYLAAAAGRRRLPPGPAAAWWIVGAAVVFRATLFPAVPSLSDPIDRLVWDARVQAAGHDPYGLAPSSPELLALRDPAWERIDRRDAPSRRPPLMRGLAAAVAWVSPTVPAFKTVLLLVELGVILLVLRLLAKSGRRSVDAILYAWNPLVVMEVAGGGHAGVVGVGLLLTALLGISAGRQAVSAAGLAGALLAAPAVGVTLPMFLRRLPGRYLWPLPLLLAGGLLAAAGATGDLLAGIARLGDGGPPNSPLFRGLLAAVTALDPTPALQEGITWLGSVLRAGRSIGFLQDLVRPEPLARTLSLMATVVAALYVSFKPWRPSREMLVALSALLLLAPAVHPWHLLWIAPLLCLHPSPGLILWTGLAPLAYVFPAATGASFQLWLVYVPVYALLLGGALRFHRRCAGSGPPPGGW